MSAAALTGIEIEMGVIGWLERLLPHLPAEAVSSVVKVFKGHWDIYEREGRYSQTMPPYLKGCNISEPEWEKVASLEEELLEMRRSLNILFVKMELN